MSTRASLNALETMIDQRVGEIAQDLALICRLKVSSPFPPSSVPGEYPHLRSGGLRDAIFAQRIRKMHWAFGVKAVKPDPSRPKSNRENLGLWLEFGTSGAREPFPEGAQSTVKRGRRENSAKTGRGQTEMEARPFLIPTVVEHGPRLAAARMGGAG